MQASLHGLPIHGRPWKHIEHIKLQQHERVRRESKLPSSQSSFTRSSIYTWLAASPTGATRKQLLCLVIKGKSVSMHCQETAAKCVGKHHLEAPSGVARCIQQWDSATMLLSDLQ